MERIDFINIKRIEWCCNDIGISVEELSKELKIPIDEVVEGKRGLTYNQLKKIADFFGRGIFFFLEEGEVEEKKIHSANFRTLTNQKPNLSLKLRKFIEQVEKKRDELLWLTEEIDGVVPDFTFPNYQGSYEKIAVQLREWLELNEKNSFDSYRAALEKKGIFVLLSNGYKGKWKIPNESPILGFSLWHSKMPVIVVRKEQVKERQTFTLIHEFAHLFLHRQSFIDDEEDIWGNSRKEIEANRLAGAILVPKKFLNEIDLTTIPREYKDFPEWLKKYRNTWGVSTEVILRRLADINKISQDIYIGYRQWLKEQKITRSGVGVRYREREPLSVFGRNYVEKVLSAKDYELISLYKASVMLDDLKIEYLHQLEKYIVGHN